jgi:hypothetical protein
MEGLGGVGRRISRIGAVLTELWPFYNSNFEFLVIEVPSSLCLKKVYSRGITKIKLSSVEEQLSVFIVKVQKSARSEQN